MKKGGVSTDLKSMVLVVSPLMKDQARAKESNVSAIYAGNLDEKTECEVCLGKYQFIFFSPESLLSSNVWHDVLFTPVYQKNLVGAIVDEAHSVKSGRFKKIAILLYLYIMYIGVKPLVNLIWK